MFDAESTMRFWRSATEAWFHYASAGFAAVAALQDQAVSTSGEAPHATRPAASPNLTWPMADVGDILSWWTKAMASYAQPQSPAADFGAGFFQFAPVFAAKPQPVQSSFSNPWTDMMQACCWSWPQVSWSAFQIPMTAWLMSVGLPYSVAVPTARANAASMDAAVAARESFDRMMSGLRPDSGQAMNPLLSMFPAGR